MIEGLLTIAYRNRDNRPRGINLGTDQWIAFDPRETPAGQEEEAEKAHLFTGLNECGRGKGATVKEKMNLLY